MIGRIATMIVAVNVIVFCMDIFRGEHFSALKDFNVIAAWAVVMLLDWQMRKMKGDGR